MKTLKYAKMIRIRRLGRFIRKLNVPTNVKEGFNFVKLLLYLTLSIHISACLWFTITQLEDHHDEEELPHQAGWVFYMTLLVAFGFLGLILALRAL